MYISKYNTQIYISICKLLLLFYTHYVCMYVCMYAGHNLLLNIESFK